MALVRRTMVNPTPPILALVNPRKKRGKSMATRKRRSSKRRVHRARAHNPVNPTRRRKTSTRRRRHSVFARTRRHNPVNPTHRRRRRTGRRRHSFRNPLRGAGSEILNFAGAGIGLGLFQPLVSRFAGPYVAGLGQYAAPALTAGSGWLLSKVLEQFSFTRRFAHPALVLGFSTAVIQIVQPIVSRTLAGAGGGMAGPYSGYRPRGMAGIGMATGVPPMITPPPLPPPQAQGMSGMAMRPGVYAR
jgi:hypothetical protein